MLYYCLLLLYRKLSYIKSLALVVRSREISDPGHGLGLLVILCILAQVEMEPQGILEGISSLHSWIKTQTMIRPTKLNKRYVITSYTLIKKKKKCFLIYKKIQSG
jgi:hypothetical protein